MGATEIGDVNYLLRKLMEGDSVSIEEAVVIANEEGILTDTCGYTKNERDNEGCVKYLLEMGCDPT